MADAESRTRPSREDRRVQLLDAADRVIARDGPDASMQAIAAEAGITKPILYRHFADKGGLLRALAERHTDTLLVELRAALARPGDLRARMQATVDAYLRFIEDRPEVYRFLTRGPGRDDPAVSWTVDVFARRLGDELAAGIAAQGLAGDAADPAGAEVRATSWGHGVVGLVRAAADVWLERRHVAREGLRDHLVALLWGDLAQGSR